MLHKNSASPLCDWQVKIFIFLTVYLTGSGSQSQFIGYFLENKMLKVCRKIIIGKQSKTLPLEL